MFTRFEPLFAKRIHISSKDNVNGTGLSHTGKDLQLEENFYVVFYHENSGILLISAESIYA